MKQLIPNQHKVKNLAVYILTLFALAGVLTGTSFLVAKQTAQKVNFDILKKTEQRLGVITTTCDFPTDDCTYNDNDIINAGDFNNLFARIGKKGTTSPATLDYIVRNTNPENVNFTGKLTITSATTTNQTITNLWVTTFSPTNSSTTNATLTNFWSTNGQITNASTTDLTVSGASFFGTATSTSLYVSGGARLGSLNVINNTNLGNATTTGLTVNGGSSLGSLVSLNSSFSNATSTGGWSVVGGTQLNSLAFTVGTSTSFGVTGGVQFGSLNVSGNSNLGNATTTGLTVSGGSKLGSLDFANATGTAFSITGGAHFGSLSLTNAFPLLYGGTGATTAAGARTNLGLVIGTDVQAWDTTLDSFAAYNTNGLLTQTAANTFTGRTITGTANQISVSNGDGVSGNPTLSIPNPTTLTNLTVTNATSSASFNIPALAGLSLTDDGLIGIDTTSGQFRWGVTSSDTRSIDGFDYPKFTIATSTAWSGTTTRTYVSYPGETWRGAVCSTDAGTLNIKFSDGTNEMTMFTASTTAGEMSFSANNTFTKGENQVITIGSPASSPTNLRCTVKKELTAD